MEVDVAVLGAGFAGASAAVRLADAGLQVALLEARPHLGGRTYATTERTTGDRIDNGQHLLMGCYHETRALLKRMECGDTVRFSDRLTVRYRGADGFEDALDCPSLPGPLHLLAGMLSMKHLSYQDKWDGVRFGLALQGFASPGVGETVAHYTRRLKQSETIQRRLWNPIAVSALNEPVDRADASLLVTVLRRAFLGRAADSLLGFPVAPLDAMHDRVPDVIQQAGGCVLTKMRAASLKYEGNTITAVTTSTGERIACKTCVSAMPAPALRDLIQRSGMESRVRVPDLGASPILSTYLWFDEDIADEDCCCMEGLTYEWAFHRHRFMRPGSHSKPCVCVIVSAARHLQHKTRQELTETALHDLRAIYPGARTIEPIAASVFWEPRATFATTPENVAKRLPARTEMDNLFLAGDWTDTGLPGTIEGAVVSGKTAAALVQQSA